MRKKIQAFGAPLVLLFLLAATRPGQYTRKDSPGTHSLLWKVSGNGIRKPSYLFGTMHVLCAQDAVISKPLAHAIQSCDKVYFEINLDDMTAMVQSMKYMQMTGNRKLSELLPDSDYQKVKAYFDNQGSILPFSLLERLKPLLITSLIEENGMQCKTTNGMELVIQQEAHKGGKKIGGLETAEFQAGLFDSIPYEQQARELVNYIDSADYYQKATADLVEMYRKQDLDKINELTIRGDASISKYIDLLLYDRNRKWADSLTGWIPSQSLVVAVGAAHLPGEKGLISLLRQKGFTVEPVSH